MNPSVAEAVATSHPLVLTALMVVEVAAVGVVVRVPPALKRGNNKDN